MADNYFEKLASVDVSAKVEQKNGLNYLSWAWAWAELKKNYPDSTYTIYENAQGWNYHTDGHTCWVKTGVTVNGIEHIEYLPVMNYRNDSIIRDKVTSFDVNKAIQRSLTKAVARHGLGLSIYAGEDIPEAVESNTEPSEAKPKPEAKKKPAKKAKEEPQAEDTPEEKERKQAYADLISYCSKNGPDINFVAEQFGLSAESTTQDFKDAKLWAESLGAES